ncbi:MAG: TIGR02281 family clan AA aspartic protease [Gammaproteobacteria bacterium]|nr:TIGR02281 family clan AA aspartic protease [Gammaproteobacteria bacterium]
MSEEHRQQKRIGVGMAIAAWVVVLLIAAYFFQDLLDRQMNPNQDLSTVETGTHSEVVLQRNKFGHYVASGTINNQPVVFFLDTGASDVSIPAGVAERLGLKRGAPTTYNTANGPITAYRTTLDRVRLGGIELRDVRASINPAIDAEEVLLGMSYLKHLEFTQRGDTLTLRQY